jgi:lipopolysaccharide/colanic/teichoic acid biosynthesis glycosyltransferase
MTKRLFDIALALVLLPPILVLLLPLSCLIWLFDRKSPLYAGPRVGKDMRPFRQLKLRTMTPNADKAGVDATPAGDPRITPLGHRLRRTKLDELPQVLNVLVGEMSFVGPRPNCSRECLMYSDVERRILSVPPGITDISSIVFSDEQEILRNEPDPDLGYHQLVRPWKSRYCLFYIEHRTLWFDMQLLGLTALVLVSRPLALSLLACRLRALGATEDLVSMTRREQPFRPMAPPGLGEPVKAVLGKGQPSTQEESVH